MPKFDFELLLNDEVTTVCVNKNKYTEEQAIEIAKEELEDFWDGEDFKVEIRTGFVKYGFHSFDGEIYNYWNIDFTQKERKRKNEVEVWVIGGIL